MSFLDEFSEFRKILGVCPCCGDLIRVSDLHLKVKGPCEKTWLDEFEDKLLELQNQEEEFEQKADEIRRKSVEQGRIAAEKSVMKMMSPGMKALGLNPYDVKPISNPVDFVVFKGLTKKEDRVDDILFLSHKVDNKQLAILREYVRKAIDNYRYDWQVARIDDEGKIKFE